MNLGRLFMAAVAAMVFLWTVSIPTVGWAQALDCPPTCPRRANDIDRLESETLSRKQTREATEQALDFRILDDTPVTYQEVLADPDNVELNFRFARTQVSQGNFRGASATLERILRLQPDLAPVRLLYAIVLFRLNNYAEAEREFEAIKALKIDLETAEQIDLFLDRIRLARRTTRYAASVSFGGQYDTNRTAAPRSNTLLLSDTPVTVARAEADFGYIGIATISATHDLGFQEGHEVFGSLTYYQDDQIAEDSLDLESFTVEVGGTMKRAFEEIDVTPSVFRTFVDLSREEFLRETGASLRFDRSFGDRVKGYASFTLSNQTFHQISENSTGSERNGRQFSFTVGGSYVISDSQLFAAELQHVDKNTKSDVNSGTGLVEKFNTFEREQLRLNHTWLLGGGQFLLNSFTYQRDRYQDPDVFISGRTRRDDIFRYRLTYGAPLSFLFGVETLPEEISDITFTPSMELLRSRSNLNNYDYKNFKAQVMFTKSWRF